MIIVVKTFDEIKLFQKSLFHVIEPHFDNRFVRSGYFVIKIASTEIASSDWEESI